MPVRLRVSSIFDFLSLGFIQEEQLTELYQDSFTVLAVFTSLPALAKQYLLRLLFVEGGIDRDTLNSWVIPSSQAKHASELAMERLFQLRVLIEGADGKRVLFFNPRFQSSLRELVCNKAGLNAEISGRTCT